MVAYLDKVWLDIQNVVPALVPEKVARENPVLAVRDLRSKVSEEPR